MGGGREKGRLSGAADTRYRTIHTVSFLVDDFLPPNHVYERTNRSETWGCFVLSYRLDRATEKRERMRRNTRVIQTCFFLSFFERPARDPLLVSFVLWLDRSRVPFVKVFTSSQGEDALFWEAVLLGHALDVLLGAAQTQLVLRSSVADADSGGLSCGRALWVWGRRRNRPADSVANASTAPCRWTRVTPPQCAHCTERVTPTRASM
jgi:hypothetical protein